MKRKIQESLVDPPMSPNLKKLKRREYLLAVNILITWRKLDSPENRALQSVIDMDQIPWADFHQCPLLVKSEKPAEVANTPNSLVNRFLNEEGHEIVLRE